MTDTAHCRYHPGTAPISSCSQCGAPLCWQCTRPSPRGFLCPTCVEAGTQPAASAPVTEPQPAAAPAAEAAAPQAQASASDAGQGAPTAQAQTQPPPPPPPPIPGLHHKLHNPTVALLLNLIPPIMGAGQMYNRQLLKGFLILLAWWGLVPMHMFHDPGVFLAMAMWVWAIFDAYFTAKDIQAGQAVADFHFFSPSDISQRLHSEGVSDRVSQELHRVGTQVHQQVGLAAAQVSQSFSKEWGKMAQENAAYAASVRAQVRAARHARPASPGWGIFMILLGVLLTLSNYDVRWTRSDLLWPILFVGIGIIFLSVHFWSGDRNGRLEATAGDAPAAPKGDSDATA